MSAGRLRPQRGFSIMEAFLGLGMLAMALAMALAMSSRHERDPKAEAAIVGLGRASEAWAEKGAPAFASASGMGQLEMSGALSGVDPDAKRMLAACMSAPGADAASCMRAVAMEIGAHGFAPAPASAPAAAAPAEPSEAKPARPAAARGLSGDANALGAVALLLAGMASAAWIALARAAKRHARRAAETESIVRGEP